MHKRKPWTDETKEECEARRARNKRKAEAKRPAKLAVSPMLHLARMGHRIVDQRKHTIKKSPPKHGVSGP